MSEENFKSALEDYEHAEFVYHVFEELESNRQRDYYYLAGYCRGLYLDMPPTGALSRELVFLHGWLLIRGLMEMES